MQGRMTEQVWSGRRCPGRQQVSGQHLAIFGEDAGVHTTCADLGNPEMGHAWRGGVYIPGPRSHPTLPILIATPCIGLHRPTK